MILGLSIKFVGAIMDLFIPLILAYTIDNVIPLGSIGRVILWGGIMLLCSVVALVTNITANRMAAKVAGNTTQALRHDLFSKIAYLSCGQVDEFTIPSLEARLTTDTYNIHQLVGVMQRAGVRAPILLLGGLFVTMMLEPVLSLILIVIIPFIGVLVYFISKKSIPLFTKLQKSTDVLVRTVRENITGIRVIKALSKTEYEKQRFSDVNEDVVQNEKKAGITTALTNPAMNILLNVGLTLVILVGAFRVNSGLTQPGRIIAFLSYFTIILNAMLSVTRLFVVYSKGSASAERISRVLEAPEDMEIEADDYEKRECHIDFEHVSFSYEKDSENKTLEDISFKLKKGETLGIIGPIGSGKSTVIRLLLRLYDPDEGDIRIGGKNIRSMPRSELHSKFGVVFQNDFLYADTIAANISFGRDLSRDDIKAAAGTAQAEEFISFLPDGYDHKLTIKSSNLSGGQKQRLLIARALAARPEILILDDSSSALDYKTDSLFRKALAEGLKETTKVIVAQRASSIMHADHILMLEDGRAIGYGTHKQLLDSCESYKEICVSQMGGGAIA